MDLEHQLLAAQRTLVEAQRLDNFKMYCKLQQARAELQALREAQLMVPVPTQQS